MGRGTAGGWSPSPSTQYNLIDFFRHKLKNIRPCRPDRPDIFHSPIRILP